MEKIKVIVIDDEEELVFTLAERLIFRGFEAVAAQSSPDAIKLVEQNDYDVAVIDIKMPVINGIELMKIFRQLKPAMKSLLMTGHGSDEEGQAGLALGACEYLIKPVKINDLVEKIKSAVGRKD